MISNLVDILAEQAEQLFTILEQGECEVELLRLPINIPEAKIFSPPRVPSCQW
ncbi:hypothetical protein [Sphingosinicella rhizophila]|uniref:Uncharacterized protein n=1 Tax=Sphingosinicella rhizophila TaxID=3050082 RepID=A0ABU3QBT3_9SPHN|nr:hypothetical protein [Sphingosinicella sp. GR2756]MDT9600862.1 hypothetical protein [Sphingosinicella sp. GR2756]